MILVFIPGAHARRKMEEGAWEGVYGKILVDTPQKSKQTTKLNYASYEHLHILLHNHSTTHHQIYINATSIHYACLYVIILTNVLYWFDNYLFKRRYRFFRIFHFSLLNLLFLTSHYHFDFWKIMQARFTLLSDRNWKALWK